jgi:hypothetical protein
MCLAITTAACGIADFDVEQPVPAQTIQGSGLPAPLAAIFPLPLNLDISSKIKAKDTGPIDGVTLSSLTLDITSPSSGGDWSFVTSIDVFVASTRSGSTLPRAKIASVASPGAVRTLSFHVEAGVNLKPYIDEGSQVDSAGTGTQPTQSLTFDGKGVFTVHPL